LRLCNFESNGISCARPGIALTLLDGAQETGIPTLISVGSGGLGRIRRTRVGGVSTKVVRAAGGPVVVRPRDA
jgi:nucleotide-binding universal stress UspA family protein